MVTAEIWIVLLLSFVIVELEQASRKAIRHYNKVTDQVVVLDLCLGIAVVCVMVLWFRIFARFFF